MTRDEIIEMAREAGLANVKMSAGLESMRADMWARFAALVATAEREACANVCEEQERGAGDAMTFYTATGQCAAAIRARNQPPKNGVEK